MPSERLRARYAAKRKLQYLSDHQQHIAVLELGSKPSPPDPLALAIMAMVDLPMHEKPAAQERVAKLMLERYEINKAFLAQFPDDDGDDE